MHWTWTNCGFTALGVFMLSARWGKHGLKYYVPRVINSFHLAADHLSQLEFLIFMVVGTIVAMAFADPSNARQSIAAGLGWTGMLASPNRAPESNHSEGKRVAK